MILAKYDDVVSLFAKWSEEGEEVVCAERGLSGTIVHHAGARFSLSTPGVGRLELSLDAAGLVFGYAEGPEAPGVPRGAAALVIAKRSEDGTLSDRLTFITIPNS